MRRPHTTQGSRPHTAWAASVLAMASALGLPLDAVAARPEITDIKSKVKVEHRLEADGVHIRATDAPTCAFARDWMWGRFTARGPCGLSVSLGQTSETTIAPGKELRLGWLPMPWTRLSPRTVQVATEARYRTGLPATAMFLPRGFARGRQQRALADDIIGYLGLGRYADHFISDLSTGTRRIVELAGLIAIDQPVLCLDEPTAGVAQREAEAFGPLINQIKTELNATVIVIEHDMPLIMNISDRIYCMEAGQVIAEGEPEAVRADPAVIASYLGTDERAIKRSQHTERQATQ